MARKTIGENNVKFQVVLPGYIDDEVDQLARASDLSKAQYIRRVLRQAVQQRAVYSQEAALALGDRKVTHESVMRNLDRFPNAAEAPGDYKSSPEAPAQSGSAGPDATVPSAKTG